MQGCTTNNKCVVEIVICMAKFLWDSKHVMSITVLDLLLECEPSIATACLLVCWGACDHPVDQDSMSDFWEEGISQL